MKILTKIYYFAILSLGETVDVFTHDGKWLAKAAYSPASQIRARLQALKFNLETNRFTQGSLNIKGIEQGQPMP